MPNEQEREKIVRARNLGFVNAISHLPEDKQKKLCASYDRQASNRERNYNTIRSQVLPPK